MACFGSFNGAARAATVYPVTIYFVLTGGAVVGIGEKAIAFCIVLLRCSAVGLSPDDNRFSHLCRYTNCFAASWMNPFSVAIAQGIADVPLPQERNYVRRAGLC